MARPRSFNIDDVLQRATELFWSQGYEATSIRDLESHLGLGRQSIYNTFGDKHALFLKALEDYKERSIKQWSALGSPDASLPEIRRFFDDMVVFATPEGPRPACLIINTLAELGDTDQQASSICRESRDRLSGLLSRALDNATRSGEIPQPESTAAAADFLVSQTYGLVLLGKSGASRAQLRALVAQALRGLL